MTNCEMDLIDTALLIVAFICVGGMGFGVGLLYVASKIERYIGNE